MHRQTQQVIFLLNNVHKGQYVICSCVKFLLMCDKFNQTSPSLEVLWTVFSLNICNILYTVLNPSYNKWNQSTRSKSNTVNAKKSPRENQLYFVICTQVCRLTLYSWLQVQCHKKIMTCCTIVLTNKHSTSFMVWYMVHSLYIVQLDQCSMPWLLCIFHKECYNIIMLANLYPGSFLWLCWVLILYYYS